MRNDYNSWHECFFGFAYEAAGRSKDPSTQCGACIVRNNRPKGIGYNGFIKGVEDTPERWEKEEKKKYVYHAEKNAIANSELRDFEDCHLYLWSSNPNVYLPCKACAGDIVQFGIRNVHVLKRHNAIEPEDDKRWDTGLTLSLVEHGDVRVHSHSAEEVHRALLTRATKDLSMENIGNESGTDNKC